MPFLYDGLILEEDGYYKILYQVSMLPRSFSVFSEFD